MLFCLGNNLWCQKILSGFSCFPAILLKLSVPLSTFAEEQTQVQHVQNLLGYTCLILI